MIIDFDYNLDFGEDESLPLITHVNQQPFGDKGLQTFEGKIGVMAITAVGNFSFLAHKNNPVKVGTVDEYLLQTSEGNFSMLRAVVLKGKPVEVLSYQWINNKWEQKET